MRVCRIRWGFWDSAQLHQALGMRLSQRKSLWEPGCQLPVWVTAPCPLHSMTGG